MDREYNDFIGDALSDSDQVDLPGKGKPLSKDYLRGDTFQHFQKIAKDAGFLPQWLKLQKDIVQQLELAETEVDIRDINEKIQKYNRLRSEETRLNSSHVAISYAVFCLKKKKKNKDIKI